MTNEHINNFIKEIINICRKYNISISHQDQGAFILLSYDEEDSNTLRNAEIESIIEVENDNTY